MDILIVGSGLFGLTMAELCADKLGLNVQIIEKRSHLGGNAFSTFDADTNIEVHQYGAHLFHTSNERVWGYVRRFTEFTDYQHRVYTVRKGEVYPMPINLGTINQYYRAAFTPDEARARITEDIQAGSGSTENLENKAVSLIGRPLYEAFIQGYTWKQWQTDPRLLPADIITRLPVRYNYDNRYFNDKYEGLPKDGYTAWLERMADHPRISIALNTDYLDASGSFSKAASRGAVPVIYTGPLDAYFEFELGALAWRTLDFELETLNTGDFQGTSVMNYADVDVPFTRILEFKHFHPERQVAEHKTIVAKEYSRFAQTGDEPYYPVNAVDDRERLKGYRDLKADEKLTVFGGRLGTYQYLDMHMAIASAISTFESSVEPHFKRREPLNPRGSAGT